MHSYVARQPILDVYKNTIGYELLFRDGSENMFPDIDSDQATSRLLSEQFMNSCNSVAGNKLSFINFSYDSIIKQMPTLIPKDKVIVEILEDCKPTDELFHAVVDLFKKGYKFALDDFIPDSRWERFFPYINIIKLDIRAISIEKAKSLIHSCCSRNIKFLAEKIETYTEFRQVREVGFDYFQGYFFGRPKIIKQRVVEPSELVVLQLCKELSLSELNFAEIEGLITRDVALSYKLLKFVNSSSFIVKPIMSFKHALIYLGQDKLRVFIYLMTVAHASRRQPLFLYELSIQRARFCERLAVKGGFRVEPGEAFIMGLFSLLDVLLDKPLIQLLSHLPLSNALKLALGKGKGELGDLLSIVLAYEKAEWGKVNQYCKVHDIKEETIITQYAEAVKWGDRFAVVS